MGKRNEAERAARAAGKSAEKDRKDRELLRGWAGMGVQNHVRNAALAEVYEVHGPERERQTAVDRKTVVRQIHDPRLKLTAQQRGIGNCYGAYFEQAQSGGSSEFLREFVDGGGVGGSGYSERQAHMMAMVRCARVALAQRPQVTYPLGPNRNGKRRGQHLPITPLGVVDSVCIFGRSLETIAISRGWFVYRGKVGEERLVVPDRQRKRIAEVLEDGLDVVAEAWDEAGYSVPASFVMMEVE